MTDGPRCGCDNSDLDTLETNAKMLPEAPEMAYAKNVSKKFPPLRKRLTNHYKRRQDDSNGPQVHLRSLRSSWRGCVA